MSAIAFVLFTPYCAAAQGQDSVWAQSQQAALAEDILNEDGGGLWNAVFTAEALGPSRISEDVRVALITRMEQLSDEMNVALAQGIPLQNVVDGEFFMEFARIVGALKDPRAVPVLVRVGDYMYSRYVARELASFGEQALPAILDTIEARGVSNDVVQQNVLTLSMMVEDAGANGLSDSARHELVRVARDHLHGGQGSLMIVREAIDLAVALNDPDLVQLVRAISQDAGMFTQQGVDPSIADMIRHDAIDALARTSR